MKTQHTRLEAHFQMQLLHTFGGCSVSRSCRNVACTFSTCEHELLQKSTQLGTILRQHLPCTAPAHSFESCCCTHPAVTAMCCAVVEPLPANMSSPRKEVLMGEEGARKCPRWRLCHSAPCRCVPPAPDSTGRLAGGCVERGRGTFGTGLSVRCP